MTEAISLERLRPGTWPEAAVARTEFHLSQILLEQDKDLDKAHQLASRARSALKKLLPLSPLDELKEVKAEEDEEVEEGKRGENEEKEVMEVEGRAGGEEELAWFDHLQPVFDGRFTGRALLKYVSNRKS